MASYGSDVLVEHDVTFDLFGRIARRDGTLSSGWDYWRWLRMERRVTTRYRRVVMMWEKDAKLPVSVLSPNGPGTTCCSSVRSGISRTWRTGFSPSTSGPLLRDKFPEMRLTVVCGPDYLAYWRTSASLPEPPVDERISLLGFVADVRPLYVEANLVLGAHDGLRWNEHQSAGGDGDRSCGGIRFLRVGRPRPDAWPQRVDRRHA